MKLVKSNVELIEQGSGLEGVYKQIEKAGRTCYKSEDNITADSAKEFVDRMIKSGHLAMLEHGTVYLILYTINPEDWDEVIGNYPRITIDDARDYMRTHPTYDEEGEENWWTEDADYIAYKMAVKYTDNPYSKVKILHVKHKINTKEEAIITSTNGLLKAEKAPDKIIVSVFNAVLITTNLRVLVENNWLDDLKYICDPTEYHAERITMKFTIDRGVSHEFVRHRAFSFAQESTRYCNYSKDKFGNEITYICPYWLNYDKVQELTEIANRDNKEVYRMGHDESLSMEERGLCSFVYDMSNHEHGYLFQISAGWSPQQARAVLPNSLKTELVMTGYLEDWKHFFDLRLFGTTGKPHPDAQYAAALTYNKFVNMDILPSEEQTQLFCDKIISKNE